MASKLFKVSLYLFRGAPFSRWPVNSSPNSTIFGRRWSSNQHGDMSCPGTLCFEFHDLDGGNISHYKDFDVGEEVTPMDV